MAACEVLHSHVRKVLYLASSLFASLFVAFLIKRLLQRMDNLVKAAIHEHGHASQLVSGSQVPLLFDFRSSASND